MFFFSRALAVVLSIMVIASWLLPVFLRRFRRRRV